MVSFIKKLLVMCRPYRRRLILGIAMGLLGGLMEPLLMLCVKVAVNVIFPGASEASTGFSPADILNPPAFSVQVVQQSNGVSKYLWNHLSLDTRQRISDWAAHRDKLSPTNDTFKATLAADLNRIILDTNFYTDERFADVNLSGLAGQMISEKPQGADMQRLNQVLLTDSFRNDLRLRPTYLEKHLQRRRLLNHVKALLPTQGFSSHTVNVILIILAIPIVMFLRGLVSYLNVYFLQWVAVRAITDLRTKLFEHLINMPLGFLSRISTGELLSRVTGDTGAVQNAISNSMVTLIKDPATLVGLLCLLIWNEPMLTLVSMIVFPLCLVPIIVYARKVRQSSKAIQTQYAAWSRIMHEGFTGNRIIKAYNLEKNIVSQFRAASAQFVNHYMRATRAGEIPGPLIEFVGAAGVACLFYYIFFISHRELDAGDFLLFVLSIFSMYRPIKSLSRIYSQLEQANAASERVFELIATPSDQIEPSQPKPLKAAGMDVHFDRINFNYETKPVLHNFQLTVKAGQLVALVGHTGSGKTTVTNLLLRFYDPQVGAVRIGGVDIREVATADLRSQIAVVTQDTLLFDETIRRNIEMGRPGASEAEIIAAAKHAHAHEFIMEKEGGYDAMIGEKGVTLSGGQKQRLAIARAILKNAPILILDEATSSLDTQTERGVQEALEELMHDRTTICIAHRLSTIQKADVIVVLDKGNIVEMGTHEALLKRDGVYRRLHELDDKPSSKEEPQ